MPGGQVRPCYAFMGYREPVLALGRIHSKSTLILLYNSGDNEIEGLTDKIVPRRLGPKRATKIRRLFNLTKEDDVRKYVIRRTLPAKEGKKPRVKMPKIQRLVTPITLQRKRRRIALKNKRRQKRREESAIYHQTLAKYAKEKIAEKAARRHSSASQSKASESEPRHSFTTVKKSKK
ncbi:unnamed protein product [Meloidogyne enterolobii]|uniref:Uncharacterized protein n=1 Tax=Meloidogyne enterolobii TaxID=390850 RepID=A0ACB1A1U1_MELEN